MPSTDFSIEYFSNDSADPTGYGEGKTFLGDTTVTTGGSGNVSFSVTLAQAVSAGMVITSTATDPSGNTSEFSDTAIAVAGNLSVLVSNPFFSFGISTLDQWLPTDSCFVINDGSVNEDFIAQISQFTDGSNTWDISNAFNGTDSIRAQWSATSTTGPWTDISAYDSDFTIATNVAVSDTVTFYFRIQTPTTTSSFNEYSSTLTVTAQEF
jgi:hypothetical protein